MKFWIKDLQKSLGITTIYVTHDQSEALTMSDRIGVMNKARVVQVGTPAEIYERPTSLFVTGFIGHSNLLDGVVESISANRVSFGLGEGVVVQAPLRASLRVGERAKLVIRPENVVIDGDEEDGMMRLPAIVESKTYLGGSIRYQLRAAGRKLAAETLNQAQRRQFEPGADVTIR